MINRMRNADIPYLADWFAISLRWLIVIGLSISLGIGRELNLLMVGVLSIPILWNGYVSALAIFNRRLSSHRTINLIIDLIFSITIFYLSHAMRGAIIWVALLPIFTSAVYYEIRGAISITLLVTSIQVGTISAWYPEQFQPIILALLVGFNIISAVAVTAMTLPLINRLRSTYQNQINQRKEGERRAQRQERDRMRALFQMIETFSATLQYQKVLETALDTGVKALGGSIEESEQTVAGVLLFNDEHLEIMANWHLYPRDLNTHFPGDEGVLAETLRSGSFQLLQQPANDPELSLMMTMNEHNTALCLPLIRGMNAYGIMLFAHKKPDFFTQERIDVLQMVSNQAVIAIQNARLYQDLAKEKERMMQTQEEAQKKLARELHDGPTQSVAAIAMRINIARKLLERSPQEAGEELVRLEDLARRTTQEIRHMLFTLRPLVLETEGLIAALETMAEKVREVYQQKVVIDADPQLVDMLETSCQTVVFALAEEAVNNARKHAEANEIIVRLKHPGNELSVALLEIADNGKGFDVQSTLGSYERRGSLGMVNLRERTELLNGLLKIDSLPGKGTRVRVYIPLTPEAADRMHQGR